VKYWLGIKEYLIYRLTGKLVEDLSMAAGTGLLNLKTLTWDQELLSQVGITTQTLPKLVKSSDIIGSVKEEYRQKLDLDESTKVIAGASDGYLSTIGVGAIDEKDFAMNVGTSGAVRCLAQESIIDKKAQFFCYPADQGYLIGGPVNNGGIVFEWARKVLLGPNESAEDFLTLAQSAPVGSKGLIFHPYLGGERAPIWNANARGSFVGLTRSHSKAEMARSVIEGIIFNLYDASHAIIQSASTPHAIRITGGFVQSDFVRQMLADVYNLPIIAMKNSEGGTLAAMFLGKQALGLSRDLSEIRKFTSEEKVYFPNPENVARYQNVLPIYREIENDLAKLHEKLTNLQNKLQ
ncbi:MAG: gluconate kinase, partial [Lactobacillus sp.]|nr:gluconate kinase [Lactobacillus sp.]